jgi:hypothetical protein
MTSSFVGRGPLAGSSASDRGPLGRHDAHIHEPGNRPAARQAAAESQVLLRAGDTLSAVQLLVHARSLALAVPG